MTQHWILERDEQGNYRCLDREWWRLRTAEEMGEHGRTLKKILIDDGMSIENTDQIIVFKKNEYDVRWSEEKKNEKFKKDTKQFDWVLERDSDGNYLCLNSEFWNSLKPEQFKIRIWNIKRTLTLDGMSLENIEIVKKLKEKESDRRGQSKHNKTEKGKLTKSRHAKTKKGIESRARSQKKQRKKPQSKVHKKIRGNMKRFMEKLALYQNMSEQQQKDFKKNCKKKGIYDIDKLHEKIIGIFPPGITVENYNKENNLEIEHMFPLAIAAKYYDIFPELAAWVQGIDNINLLHKHANKLKHDYIFLDCIPKNCPGYPDFPGINETIYKSIFDKYPNLDRSQFEHYFKVLEKINSHGP